MSLLLDALKKAAEKKARKSAEGDRAVDRTEIDHADGAQSATHPDEEVTSTVIDNEQDTQTLTTRGAREVDATVVDQTEIEKTQLDETEVEQTQPEHTNIDSTQIDRTQIDKTEIDNRALDNTDIDNTDIDRTDIDRTDIDRTDIDRTDIDRTELDRTELDITDIETSDDETSVETTEIKYISMDASRIESASVEPPAWDETDDEQLELQTDDDDIAAEHTDTHTLTDEDKTLQFYEDDADDDALILAATETREDRTRTQITETQNSNPRRPPFEAEALTDDDVTEFMGDGLTADEIDKRSRRSAPPVQSGNEDTTITNRDSTNLRTIDYEELSLEDMDDSGYPMAGQDSRNDRSHGSYDGRVSRDDSEPQYALEEIDYLDEPSTVRAEATSSTIDIDKLTSDETVTIKDSTSTRTFAPDNYDRTLLKLADSDVSRIFPGMKSESDKAMTPDYAKRVFLNKSQGVNRASYKVYSGLALAILMAVSIWGLFELQDESDSIDRSLLALKRDPMPGIIKPKVEDKSPILFPVQSDQGEQIRGMLANAGALNDSEVNDSEDARQQDESDGQAMATESKSADSSETDTPAPDGNEASSAIDKKQTTAASAQSDVKQKQDAPARDQPAAVRQGSSSELVIRSSSRVSEKDQLLASAYEAYQNGERLKASRLYEQVLSLDPENRDALLGRAAIHVKNNEAGRAILYYQKVLESNPKDSMAMTSLISVANIDPVAGETQIKGLLRDQPQSPFLHFALGNMYGSQNRWTEAQSSYFTALQYRPADPDYAYNLAVSLDHMQKTGTAISYYQLALENNSYGRASFDSQLVGQRIEVLSQ
jgi:tetratricopeptide (TPR) repeat protein